MNILPDNTILFEPILDAPAMRAPKPLPFGFGRPPCASQPDIGSGIAQEIAAAHAIQQSLLPKEFPKISSFGLAAFCQSVGGLGGDFYDALSLGHGKVLLFVADVMGTGVPAALFAASLRMLVRSEAERVESPSELLTWVNRQMFCELSSVDMFITAQMAMLDTKRGLLRVASAGHCPLLALDEQGRVEELAPKGLPLGIEPEEEYLETAVPLNSCSCAVMYTDGLTEASDAQGNLFGQERLEEWLGQSARKATSAEELKRNFLHELSFFRGQEPSRDDLTLLVMAREERAPVSHQTTRDAELLSAPFAE